MKIYSMKGLAQKEGVTHDYLRVVVSKVKTGKVENWRDYRFFGIDGKCWFAYPKDETIEFFDEVSEQSTSPEGEENEPSS